MRLTDPVETITRALVDIPSVSGSEAAIADLVESSLRGLDGFTVLRDGNAVVAQRAPHAGPTIVLAGHLDTVPIAGNLPAEIDGDILRGCGTTDMKGGVAVALRLAATLGETSANIRYVFYDQEEVEASKNGLGRLARKAPELLDADFAVLLEPTDGYLEAGCQGSLRVVLSTTGQRAHTARAWMGTNAIQEIAPLLERLRQYQPRTVEIDGLTYREGLQAVRIDGGVAGNVVPDLCQVAVNHRFAPDRTPEQAEAHLRDVFAGYGLTLEESAPAARPHLSGDLAGSLASICTRQPRAKLGWTDVARFEALGIPAVNYGPGDPQLAHTPGEFVQMSQIRECEDTLRHWLTRLQ